MKLAMSWLGWGMIMEMIPRLRNDLRQALSSFKISSVSLTV